MNLDIPVELIDNASHEINYENLNGKILIGLMGYAKSGKDTIAKTMVSRLGFKRLSFADTLKEDLNDFNGLEKISAIKVYDFKWKGKNDRQNGVIAHELAEVLPYAVSGEKDGEEMQGVDYSKIVPVLVKAIQELQSQITELKNK